MKYVFMDRDGTLVVDERYNNRPELQLFPQTVPALRLLKDADFALAVVTNQSGVARGIVKEENLRSQNNYLTKLLLAEGIEISIEICPHLSDCHCRKPEIGMLQRFPADFGQSYMVGDKWSDVECGHRAGCTSILITDEPVPNVVSARNILEAAQYITMCATK